MVVVADDDVRVLTRNAALHAPDADATDIIVIINGRNEDLQTALLVHFKGREVIENGIEQRNQVVPFHVGIERRCAVAPRAEHERAFELIVRRVEIHQKFQHFVDDFFHARVGAVDLVDNDNEFQPHFERLLRDETRLRHGTFRSVHKNEHARDHLQHAFHFAREIRVPGRIDDIDLYAVIVDRRIFCQNRNASLALQCAGVHDALFHDLILAERAALFEHLIDERRLAVIDVCNDRNVS